jgi:hypothetical protein
LYLLAHRRSTPIWESEWSVITDARNNRAILESRSSLEIERTSIGSGSFDASIGLEYRAIICKSYIFWANVLDHRWLLVARLLPKRSEAESAGGVTRVAIRWIALFDFIILE